MFQFPGFALKTLCIQVLSTCFSDLLTTEVIIGNCQVGCPIQKFMDQKLIDKLNYYAMTCKENLDKSFD